MEQEAERSPICGSMAAGGGHYGVCTREKDHPGHHTGEWYPINGPGPLE